MLKETLKGGVFRLDGQSYRLETSLGPEDTYQLTDYPVTITMKQPFKNLPEEL